jgi:hypothetical protein
VDCPIDTVSLSNLYTLIGWSVNEGIGVDLFGIVYSMVGMLNDYV